MTTLADTRGMNLAGATGMMETLAHCACRLAITKAKKAKRLTEIESEFADKLLPDEQQAELLTLKLKEFCRANPHLFQTPRKVKTAFGEFGLQTVSDLAVENPDVLLQTLMDRAYEDCMKTEIRIIKDAVRARLEAGEEIPGATVRRSENDPVVKIAPKLLKEAVAKA